MKRYTFTDQEKVVLIPLIENRYISIFETYSMPHQKDMDAINELKDEFSEEEKKSILLGKESRSVLCSIIDESLISPHAELMSDFAIMNDEEKDSMAVEYLEIIEKVKHYMSLKNKLYPFKKNKNN